MILTIATIEHVVARQILDSRGRPTIEVDVSLTDGTTARASAPSGASTGRHEAIERRDRDIPVYGGRGVMGAVAGVVEEIAPRLHGMKPTRQAEIDAALVALDGTAQLDRLGGNAIIATSIAVCRAAALASRRPLYSYIAEQCGDVTPTMPMPMTNILSGGAHAGRSMDLQDFLAMPVGAATYRDALEMISRVRNSAAELMAARNLPTLLADEGGLSPGFAHAREALELMVRAFEHAGLKPGHDMAITLDVAASELFDGTGYALTGAATTMSADEMTAYLVDLVAQFPIVSIEDPLDQDDWEGWRRLTRALGHIQIVGDDLFVTNPERINRGIGAKIANAALIKINQNGTLSGTLDAVRACRAAGYATVISARSGETEDSFIADLAVGTGAGQIKIGSVRNSERMAKYNQLLRIEKTEDFAFARIDGLAGMPSTPAYVDRERCAAGPRGSST